MVQKNNKIKTSKVSIDTKLYPLEAIYGASSVFVDRVYIFLSNYKDKKLDVEFKVKEGEKKENLEKMEGEFMNELMNYVYRINIAKTNKKIREQIVQRALYSSIGDSLLSDEDDEDDEDDDNDDPLGIKNPWNE